MELSIFINGIQQLNKIIASAIRSEGIHVIHESSYSYTVGMRDVGNPELLVRGLRPAESEEILRTIYRAIMSSRQIGIEVNIREIFEPRLELTDISKCEKSSIFYACRVFYGDWLFLAKELTIH